MCKLLVLSRVLSLALLISVSTKRTLAGRKFPDNFKFGVATASYQIEGAWNEDGKGENIWDNICHTNPDYIVDKSNGDIACDSYHKWREDVAIIKELGVDYYRFSLSWSRILPTGYPNKINKKGVAYYENLIQELIRQGIEPVVTIYHWDLPQPIHETGGWLNASTADAFREYAKVCFKIFGPFVKTWLTFNEPISICHEGYGSGIKAPAIQSSGVGEYICGHNLLRAHAQARFIYNIFFKRKQKGRISMALSSPWVQPSSESAQNTEAAERTMQFMMGWFAHPLFKGDYPEIMKERIANRSKLEGFSTSRLPKFTILEKLLLKNSCDFLALNAYTSGLITHIPDLPIGEPSFAADLGVLPSQDPSWGPSGSAWLKVYPEGMRKLLNWIKKEYNNVEIIITENGFSDKGELNDTGRIDYLQSYLDAVQTAISEDEVNVSAYTAWSLMDNFEWAVGYTERFGLYNVDFNSPNRTRTPKQSAIWYANAVKTHCIYEDGCDA